MKLVRVAFVLLALAALFWFLRQQRAAPVPSTSQAVAPGATPLEAPPALSLAPSPPASKRVEPEPPTVGFESPSPAERRCRILGRFVDEHGAPIAGIRVIAHSVDGSWARGIPPQTVEVYGEEIEGYAAVADAAGRFSIEAPLPTSDWISLLVDSDDFHNLLSRDFGPAGGRNQPRLAEGNNDLGDLALATAGVVEGVVRSREGEPIEDAEVRLDGEYPGGLGVRTRTTTGGHYRLGHLPPGACRLGVDAEGWLSARGSSVDVRARDVTPGIDFVLDAAPSISGVVVDERDSPVAGVRLWAWPQKSGRGAGAESGEDGTFEILLPQDEPYRFDFEHPGFEPYG